MKRLLGMISGMTGGLLSLLLAGVSDMGRITVPSLALGLLGAATLVGASYALTRSKERPSYRKGA